VVHIGKNSPEYVAYRLLLDLRKSATATDITQDKFLDLYAECLLAVIDPHGRYAGRHKELQHR
jgi:hypothetical protein